MSEDKTDHSAIPVNNGQVKQQQGQFGQIKAGQEKTITVSDPQANLTRPKPPQGSEGQNK